VIDQSDKAVPVFAQHIFTNHRQVPTLAAIRGSLLLKLLSGEIPIKDAGNFFEKVI